MNNIVTVRKEQNDQPPQCYCNIANLFITIGVSVFTAAALLVLIDSTIMYHKCISKSYIFHLPQTENDCEDYVYGAIITYGVAIVIVLGIMMYTYWRFRKCIRNMRDEPGTKCYYCNIHCCSCCSFVSSV